MFTSAQYERYRHLTLRGRLTAHEQDELEQLERELVLAVFLAEVPGMERRPREHRDWVEEATECEVGAHLFVHRLAALCVDAWQREHLPHEKSA